MLTSIQLAPSFGFGDRLGLATPGHIAALRAAARQIGSPAFRPIFAQQSVRENTRTGRSPQQVLDAAREAVEAAGWEDPWGADADHVKTVDDLPPFVRAGYTFFTLDPSAHVNDAADHLPLERLHASVSAATREALAARYVVPTPEPSWGTFDEETLLRAQVKYGHAIEHVALLAARLNELTAGQTSPVDLEVSVDETEAPTTPLEHFFIANELMARGVRFTSLAPRFIGRFEKGVDYIGDLAALDASLARHAAVTTHFGTYKLSLHSGSDKFSVYPLIRRHWRDRIHVKTAGTSYLEGLRTLAGVAPDLFHRIYAFSREQFESDRHSYHVSAELIRLPTADNLSALLDDFHARQVLHVTFGSCIVRFGAEIDAALRRNLDVYHAALARHFERHLAAFAQGSSDHDPA